MSRRSVLVVAMALIACAELGGLGACSDPPNRPPPGTGGSSGSSIGAGGGGGEGGTEGGVDANTDAEGGVCNDVANNGQLVDRVGITGEPPTATGGTVDDGLYDLTDFSVYVGVGGVGGPTGITGKGSLRIANGKFDEILELGGTGKTTTTQRTSSSFAAAGATIAITELCPTAGGGKQLQFTANPPLLILTNLTSKEAFTFTKR